MAKPVVIMADSVCDLTPKLLERFHVRLLPLTVSLGAKSYRDGIDLGPEDIYAAFERDRTLPQTSAISPQEFADIFRPHLEAGYKIVHLDLSSRLSSCLQNARLAADYMEGVYPVDTCQLSSGMGLAVMEACRLRDLGLPAAEIAAQTQAYVSRISTSFVLNTLEYMWKGGRCSGVTAMGANLLHIKPCLEMQDGNLKVCKKYRGPIQKVYVQYVRDRLAAFDIDPRYLFITHSGRVSDETCQELAAIIREAIPVEEIFITQAGCTVTSHCGPSTLGLAFATRA